MKGLLPIYQPNDYKREPVGFADGKEQQEIQDDKDHRSPFQRDCSRLIHSPSFRKLQGKTQIFPGLESDFFRNRLTHSLEVADIGKSVTLRINASKDWKGKIEPIDLDIIQFACLAHDLGHPPFGHVGERALNSCMKDSGRFEGNAQTFRILGRLEKKRTFPEEVYDIYQNQGFEKIAEGKYRDRRKGLNLTSRVMASILKYDNCIEEGNLNQDEGVIKGYYNSDKDRVDKIKADVLGGNYDKSRVKKVLNNEVKFNTIECSIMDLADDIAYTVFDLEDALKSRFINLFELSTIHERNSFFNDFLTEFSSRISKNKYLKTYVKNIKVHKDDKLVFKSKHFDFYQEHVNPYP